MAAFVGIDPGLTGAMAVLDHTGLRHLVDLPVMTRSGGTVKNQINPAAFRSYLQECLHGYDKSEVMIALELARAMPKQGVASMVSIGLTAGLIEGVIAARGYTYELVTPQVWKKPFKLKSDKEACRAAAVRLFPEADIHKKKDHNRAEALLIARWAQLEYA